MKKQCLLIAALATLTLTSCNRWFTVVYNKRPTDKNEYASIKNYLSKFQTVNIIVRTPAQSQMILDGTNPIPAFINYIENALKEADSRFKVKDNHFKNPDLIVEITSIEKERYHTNQVVRTKTGRIRTINPDCDEWEAYGYRIDAKIIAGNNDNEVLAIYTMHFNPYDPRAYKYGKGCARVPKRSSYDNIGYNDVDIRNDKDNAKVIIAEIADKWME